MCLQCADLNRRLSRRALFAAMAATAGAAALPRRAFAQAAQAPQNAISAAQALQRLMDGNARYVANAPANQDRSAGRAARVSAQHPIAAILSCADSRVAPELAFDQGPGDLFVVRVAGNFVNEDGLASLEYAVKFLNTPLVMVLGHSGCGAVDAAIKVVREQATLPGHLQAMLKEIKPAVEAVQGRGQADLLSAAVAENVRLGVRRLQSAAPILVELVQSKTISVVGAQYDLASGKVEVLPA